MSKGRLARARPKWGSWFTCQALKSIGVLLLGGSVGIIAPGANVTWLSLEGSVGIIAPGANVTWLSLELILVGL